MSCSKHLAGNERVSETFGLLSVEMTAQEIGLVTPSKSSKRFVHPLALSECDNVTPSLQCLLIHTMSAVHSYYFSPQMNGVSASFMLRSVKMT